MKFRLRIAAFAAATGLAVVGLGAPATAQVQELAIPSENDWQHQWTAMEFPADLGKFERNRVMQFEERQTNVAANYADLATQTILTLYIYRPPHPDTSIWFDRALVAIGAGEFNGRAASFTPNGGTAESGQYAAIKVRGNYRSTAVALYRAGEWLVKVRISSRKLKVDAMENLMTSTLAALPALEGVSSSPAYIVAPCDEPMQFGGASPVPAEEAQGMAMALALSVSSIAMSVDGEGAEEAATPARFCREGERQQRVNLYRPGGSQKDYVLAMGDSGFSVDVSPQMALDELMGEESNSPSYQVRSANGLETTIHTAFSGMPTPEQAMEAVFNAPALARINRPLGEEETNVELSVPSNNSEGQ